MSKQVYINYLERVLIPDLEASGKTETANDFKACVAFMRGAEEIEIMDEEIIIVC